MESSSEVQKSVLEFINELFEWEADREHKVHYYHEGDKWEAELWSENPTSIEEIFRTIRERIDRCGDTIRSGRNMSFANGAGNYASCLGELLASQLDMKSSGAGKLFEKVIIKWMCHEFALSPEADGYLTCGGTSSTVISVAAAREATGVQVSDSESLTIYMTPLTHACFDKALVVAGLTKSKIREVQLDVDCGMDCQDLERQIMRDKEAGLRPFMIAATFGTISLGSIDPLQDITKLASKYNIWLHVDGALAGFLPLCLEGKTRAKGQFRSCDSIILDSHKILGQPFGSSVVLFKNGRHKLLGIEPEKSTWSNPLENEMTPRGFPLWFSLNVFGVKTFRDTMKKHFELARYAADYLRGCPNVVVHPLFSMVVAFRCDGSTEEESNAKTNKWYALLRKDGRVRLSSTMEKGFIYIRIACCNFRAHLSEFDFCLELLMTKLKEVLGVHKLKLPLRKPSTSTRWLHKFEMDTKGLEKDLRLQQTSYFLERTSSTGFLPKHDFNNLGNRNSFGGMTLSPSEAPASIDALLEAVLEIPRKDISKTRSAYAGVLGQFLTSILNVFTGQKLYNPGAVELEQRIIQHLGFKFGMPQKSCGVLSSDRCTSNILALLTGRYDKSVIELGAPRYVVYTSKRGHPHFLKPLHILGLSSCTFHIVDSDCNGALDPEDLTRNLTRDKLNPNVIPWLVAENITGGHDSEIMKTSKIADLLVECNVWHHVEISGLDQQSLWSNSCTTLKDFSSADSLSVEIGADLDLSIGIAALIVSEPRKLRRALTYPREMPYLPDEGDDTFGAFYYSFELSRPCRALPLWFTLNFLGLNNLK